MSQEALRSLLRLWQRREEEARLALLAAQGAEDGSRRVADAAIAQAQVARDLAGRAPALRREIRAAELMAQDARQRALRERAFELEGQARRKQEEADRLAQATGEARARLAQAAGERQALEAHLARLEAQGQARRVRAQEAEAEDLALVAAGRKAR